MKKIVLVSLLALLAVAPASAKELESVSVCGISDCVTFRDRAQSELLANVGPPTGAPAPAGPYYVLTYKGHAENEDFGWKSFYVPATGQTVSIDDSTQLSHWAQTLPGAQALIASATAKLKAFPAPKLESVRVDNELVSGDVQDYLRLFEIGQAAGGDPSSYDWVSVDLVSSGTTPWTGSDRDLMFSPSGRFIERGTTQVRIDAGIASDVAAARPLSFDRGGFAWLTLAIVFGAIALLIALGLAAQRVRTASARRPTTA